MGRRFDIRYTPFESVAATEAVTSGEWSEEVCEVHDAFFCGGCTIVRICREFEPQTQLLRVLRGGADGSTQEARTYRWHGTNTVPATRPKGGRWILCRTAVEKKRLRCLNIVDDFTMECLAIEVDISLPVKRVVAVLEWLVESRGVSSSVTFDNGPEFACKTPDKWAYEMRLKLKCSTSGKPQENACIEASLASFAMNV
ncbi:DDE-type integrase/transposase/recombinase [Pseudoduganella sp. UC29_106]|uniref:DDE-type integrase/transposase/recombinase n=1 Tax=Pseudoduganella sp. UC29_106 TaxID=3374553 RepID=UPI0037567C48